MTAKSRADRYAPQRADDQDDYRLDGYAVVLALVVVAFAVLTAAILTGVWS